MGATVLASLAKFQELAKAAGPPAQRRGANAKPLGDFGRTESGGCCRQRRAIRFQTLFIIHSWTRKSASMTSSVCVGCCGPALLFLAFLASPGLDEAEVLPLG